MTTQPPRQDHPARSNQARDRGRAPLAHGVTTRRVQTNTPAGSSKTAVLVAAVADLHLKPNPPRRFRTSFQRDAARADLLVLAGDLTDAGTPEQARLVAEDLAGLSIPVVAVLGNHDYHAGRVEEVVRILADAGVHVLEGTGVVLSCRGIRVGVAGVKGYGGGFPGGMVHEFGEPETKAFARYGRLSANRLEAALSGMDCDVKVALTHYAPTPETLQGENPQLYPILGSHHLGEAIDKSAVDMAIHGHAHRGREHGTTPGGVPVRNVAYPVIKTGVRTYVIQPTPAAPSQRSQPTDTAGPNEPPPQDRPAASTPTRPMPPTPGDGL